MDWWGVNNKPKPISLPSWAHRAPLKQFPVTQEGFSPSGALKDLSGNSEADPKLFLEIRWHFKGTEPAIWALGWGRCHPGDGAPMGEVTGEKCHPGWGDIHGRGHRGSVTCSGSTMGEKGGKFGRAVSQNLPEVLWVRPTPPSHRSCPRIPQRPRCFK